MSTMQYDGPRERRSTLSSVIAGAILALGLMIMFALLGLALGITSLEALGEGLSMGAAIYVVVTQLVSLAGGGFAAARLSDFVDSAAAAVSGAAVWALVTLVVALGGWSAGTAILGSTATLVSQSVQSIDDAAEMIVPEDFSLPDISEIAGSLSLGDVAPEIQQALERADVTPAQLRTEAREAFRNVISQQEMSRARAVLAGTVSDIARQPGTLAQEVNGALDQLVQGENPVFGQEDIDEAARVLETRLGISPSEADGIADAVQTSFDEAVETLRTTAAELQSQLVEAMNAVQSTASTTALWTFIASALGLISAAGAGIAARRN